MKKIPLIFVLLSLTATGCNVQPKNPSTSGDAPSTSVTPTSQSTTLPSTSVTSASSSSSSKSSSTSRPTSTSSQPTPKKDFDEAIFENKCFPYDGEKHSLVVENVPTGTKITYQNNDKIEVGIYQVKATLEKAGYNTRIMSATLTICEVADPIGVDPDKTAFPINSDTTFDDFKENIFKGNFTIAKTSGTRIMYHDKGEHSHYKQIVDRKSSEQRIAVDESQYYKVTNSYLSEEYNDINYSKIVGDYCFSYLVEPFYGINGEFYKMPSKYFDETFAKANSSYIFDHVKRTEDNKFEQLIYVDYYVYFSKITIEDNKFTLEVYNHVEHDEADYDGRYHDAEEYDILSFYNIGNTKLTIPECFVGKVKDADKYELNSVIHDGILYEPNSDGITANITLTTGELEYLPKGHIELLPDIYDKHINVVTMDLRTCDFGEHAADYTGMILDTQFNSQFVYGLKYKQYGKLKTADINRKTPKLILNKFEVFGGEVNYHEIDADDVGFFQIRSSKSIENLDKYNLTVIDVDKFSTEQINKIKSTGTKVIGYLNVGMLDKSSTYYEDFKDITFADCKDNPNARWINVGESQWIKYVKETLIPNILNKGADGIYLDGVRVYDEINTEEASYLTVYNARQAVSSFVLRIDYLEKIVMMQSCDDLMYDLTCDGTSGYAPYYVDYYVQEEVLTKVVDRNNDLFDVQDETVTEKYFESLNAIIEKFKLDVVLLEYSKDSEVKKSIINSCEEAKYHCFIADTYVLA